jgi:hypothetical protein
MKHLWHDKLTATEMSECLPGIRNGVGVVVCLQKVTVVRPRWLKPVILATQEAEIKRIADRRQPQQNSLGDHISKKSILKKGWWSGLRCRPWVQTPVPKTTQNKRSRKESWRPWACPVSWSICTKANLLVWRCALALIAHTCRVLRDFSTSAWSVQ